MSKKVILRYLQKELQFYKEWQAESNRQLDKISALVGKAGGESVADAVERFVTTHLPTNSSPEGASPQAETQPCILNCDSPSYPPDDDERRQCGCPLCLKDIIQPAPVSPVEPTPEPPQDGGNPK